MQTSPGKSLSVNRKTNPIRKLFPQLSRSAPGSGNPGGAPWQADAHSQAGDGPFPGSENRLLELPAGGEVTRVASDETILRGEMKKTSIDSFTWGPGL